MLTIVSICNYPLDDNINGMVFYPTEMLHHIKLNYDNIHILESSVIPTDYFNRNKLFEHKYISLHKFVDLKDISNNSVLLLNTESYFQLLMNHYEVLEKSKCIWFFNSFNIENAFINQLLMNHKMLSRYLKIQYKSFLLHEQGFENGATENNFLFPQILFITRGIEYQCWSKTSTYSDDRFFYHRKHNFHNIMQMEQDEQIMIQWCNDNSLDLTMDFTINPDLVYKGLLYVRTVDYMPRSPFEFLFRNKPVIFFKLSSGLIQRGFDFELYKPTYSDQIDMIKIPSWDIKLLIKDTK